MPQKRLLGGPVERYFGNEESIPFEMNQTTRPPRRRAFRESKSPTAIARRIDSATAGPMNSPLVFPTRRGRRKRQHWLFASGGSARLAELRCHRRSTILRAEGYWQRREVARCLPARRQRARRFRLAG